MPNLIIPGRWVQRAACAAHPLPNEWFRTTKKPGRPAKNPRPTPPSTAKQVCAACPVRTPCLQYALRTREQFGIWGGLTPKERIPLASCQHCNQPAGGTSIGDEIVPRIFCSRACQWAHEPPPKPVAVPTPPVLYASCLACGTRFEQPEQGIHESIRIFCTGQCRRNDERSRWLRKGREGADRARAARMAQSA